MLTKITLFRVNIINLMGEKIKSIHHGMQSPGDHTTQFSLTHLPYGCNSQEEVEEACIVSVEETTLSDGFFIFPNPANDHLNIQLSMEKPERLHITVLNVSGQQMAAIADEQTKAGKYQAEIDISNWPAGVYLCRLKVGNEVVSRKIIMY